MASTIKPKKGRCKLCPPNFPETYITKDGLCQNHYWSENAKKNAEKKKKNGTAKAKAKTIKEFKPIPKISQKRKIENAKYIVLRIEFLGKKENSICPVTGEKTTEIHHKKGRVGSLFLNTKFWLGVSRKGHKKIEENPEWAKKEGYSLSRLSKE